MSKTFRSYPDHKQVELFPDLFTDSFHVHRLFGEPVYETVDEIDENGETVYEEITVKKTVYIKTVKNSIPDNELPEKFYQVPFGNYFQVFKTVEKVIVLPKKVKAIAGFYADYCTGQEDMLHLETQKLLGVFQPCYRLSGRSYHSYRRSKVNRYIRHQARRSGRRNNNDVLHEISKRYAKGFDYEDNYDFEAKVIKEPKAIYW